MYFRIKVTDLKNQYLRAMFQKDSSGALDNIESIKCNESKLDYERHLIVAFWYSVHLERMNLSRHFLH